MTKTFDDKQNREQMRPVPAGLAVALVSAGVLTYEIVLTRIFSVMLSYHYVFAVVSFALLGLGVGGMLRQTWSRWFPNLNFAHQTALLALVIALAVLGIVGLPIYDSEVLANFGFWIYLLLATLPFFFAGLILSGLFQALARYSSWLYGADLLGATGGALAVAPLLNAFGGVQAALLTAVPALAGAYLLWLAQPNRAARNLRALLSLTAGVLLLGLLGKTADVPIARDLNKDLYRALANPLDRAEIVESRWSAFGRTDLVRSTLTPNEMTIFVDGAAGSVMFNLDSLLANPTARAHLQLHYGAFFPFYFLKEHEKDNALIIGAGGGRDVVVALLGGVKRITAVEVNPDVVQLVRDYAWFNGGIYSDLPEVEVVVAEGRNFVRNADTKYDLIMLAIPITKSSRSIEGYALTENYLFTVESLRDYLDHLTPEGRIVIVAHDRLEIYRLVSVTLAAFAGRGVSQDQTMKHLYTVASEMMPTIVIKKQPLDSLEARERHALLHRIGRDQGSFYVPYVRQVVLRPGEPGGLDLEWRMFDQILVDISTGKLTLEQLKTAAVLDIGPVTDDRPFFYKFQPGLPPPFDVFALLILLVGGLVVGLVLLPASAAQASVFRSGFLAQLRLHAPLRRFLLLFLLLGLAFMLVEVALFQKLTLYLGQPVFTLTVLLFSLLLGGGLGSLASSRVRTRLAPAMAGAAFLVAVLTAAFTLSLKEFFQLGLEPRWTATLMLLPLGMAMGMPFPLALRLMKESGFGESVHFMWGVNGVASVLGSALTMIVGMLVGFSWALWLGALFYVGIATVGIWLAGRPAVNVFNKNRASQPNLERSM